MFSVGDRDALRDRVLEIASSDPRIVAGAVVGSLALSEGDCWSDLDLSFAVADGIDVAAPLRDWTNSILSEFKATHLFDLPSGPSIYRVFLLPGCLQFDLSFTPASQFGAVGPKFRILFGSAVERPQPTPTTESEHVGYAIHHAVHARICIERGRFWQAEYWISSCRNRVISLACCRRGLSPSHGRGIDDLPTDVRERFISTFTTSLDRCTLQLCLGNLIGALLCETDEIHGGIAEMRNMMSEINAESAESGTTDNPDDAQCLREDH